MTVRQTGRSTTATTTTTMANLRFCVYEVISLYFISSQPPTVQASERMDGWCVLAIKYVCSTCVNVLVCVCECVCMCV